MDAIEYLTDQHYEIESVFDQIETAARATTRRRLCRKLAELFAVHRAVEERIFYPAVRAAGMKELLAGALEEHLLAECTIGGIAEMREVNDEAMVRMAALRKWNTRHVDEEERTLFPRARELLKRCQLEVLGERMETMADELLRAGARARGTALTVLA